MLINSVLAFIRELLPVFIMLAIVLQLELKRGWQLVAKAVTLGLIAIFILSLLLARLTQWFDGNGLELLFILLQLSTLTALLLLLVSSRFKQHAVKLAIFAQVVLAGINLLLFALTVSSTEAAAEAVWLGAVLGLGIGCSIAVLLYQMLSELARLSQLVSGLMIALIGARQISETVALLGQMDWLTLEHKLWDSSAILAEQTEVGVFFHAWFGYEATPDVIQACAWLVIFSLMLVIWFRRGAKS